MSKLVMILYSFVVLASAKEYKLGQNCELRCCTIPEGDVLCRERCLGLSCKLDVHCDGDCCVNSTCSSCLLKRASQKNKPTQAIDTDPDVNARLDGTKSSTSLIQERMSQNPITTGQKSGGKTPKTTNSGIRMANSSKTRNSKINNHECSLSNNQCASGCCIDERCVDPSYCTPIKSARGGRGGGGSRGGGRFGGGGGGGSSGGSWNISLTETILLIVGIIVGVVLLIVGPMCCCCLYDKYNN